MAGSTQSQRTKPAQGTPRNPSMDSAVSGASLKSSTNKQAFETPGGTEDIAKLVKTAGSLEAVIQYLLKEKQSQAQQNNQLWRLVDKQRAMIMGLNKDLERALKEKEKYRKKLKEVIVASDAAQPLPTLAAKDGHSDNRRLQLVKSLSVSQADDATTSPLLDSDCQRQSPIEITLAPYPITPPADQPADQPLLKGLPDAEEHVLDPSPKMPDSKEHASDGFDHEEEDGMAEAAGKESDGAKDLLYDSILPPSRSVPDESHRPTSPSFHDQSPELDDGLVQFPAPPANQPRKARPDALNLGDKSQDRTMAMAYGDFADSGESDPDNVFVTEKLESGEDRGRRRTREEDERDREMIALEEERRSMSKKSKSGSHKGTARAHGSSQQNDMRSPPPIDETILDQGPVDSLAGVLNRDAPDFQADLSLVSSPGSPVGRQPSRRETITSSPGSPLRVPSLTLAGLPPSPRPPYTPLPLPPNTPNTPNTSMHTPCPPIVPLELTSPKPLKIVKQSMDGARSSTISKNSVLDGLQSTTERSKIFRGFVTDEHPDLLLSPDFLSSVHVKVASSRMKPSRASLMSTTQLEEDPVFTLAVLSRVDDGELWRVEKDSASLAKLDQTLKQCPAFTARAPDRTLFSGHAPAKIDARRIALNKYFEDMIKTMFERTMALELLRYLSTNTLPPNADETGSSMENNPEAPPKCGPDGRPYRSGYLTKRGKLYGGWKARFFVLNGPQLKYYETPGGAHLGTIKLPNAQIGKGKHSQHGSDESPTRYAGEDAENQYRHAFVIKEPKKKDPSRMTRHVLCAENDTERDQWVETLLCWIDYKDIKEERRKQKESMHDRTTSDGQNASMVRARVRQNQPATASKESLISVGYDAAKQGDSPQSTSARGPEPENGSDRALSTVQYTISAPRDGHAISNSEMWGMKSGGLAPPGPDEKKMRKRSFFGFGSKTRSSSDGQDFFGVDSAANTAGGQQNGPVRQVFGASLAEAVRYYPPTDVQVPLPAVVYRCIQYLDAKKAVNEEGIFRLSGSNLVIKQLRERFNTHGDIDLVTDPTYYDIHAVASLLKLYLRELPTTILTRDLHLHFVSVTEMTSQQEKISALSQLVQRLPTANATLLKYLIAFLIRVIDNQEVNKMSVRNVGIVFSPTLNIPPPVFALLLQNYEPVFGMSAHEYQLSSGTFEQAEQRPIVPDRKSSDGRPSTAGSPYRYRLEQTSRRASRSTPTPPPTTSMQQTAQFKAAQMQARMTPAPPGHRQTAYDLQYLAQQDRAGSQVSTHLPYGTGLETSGHGQAHYLQVRLDAGYDRPPHENAEAILSQHDSSAAKRNRRSTMFAGSIMRQSSRSPARHNQLF